MEPVYMVATWKEYPFENLLDIRFARDENGIKAIIADEYNDLYSKEVYNFRFDWQEMEVAFLAKATWDDEADEEKVYIIPIYPASGP